MVKTDSLSGLSLFNPIKTKEWGAVIFIVKKHNKFSEESYSGKHLKEKYKNLDAKVLVQHLKYKVQYICSYSKYALLWLKLELAELEA